MVPALPELGVLGSSSGQQVSPSDLLTWAPTCTCRPQRSSDVLFSRTARTASSGIKQLLDDKLQYGVLPELSTFQSRLPGGVGLLYALIDNPKCSSVMV